MDYETFKGLLFVMGFDVRVVDGDSAFVARLAEPRITVLAVGDWVNKTGDKPLKPFIADVYIKGVDSARELMYETALELIRENLHDNTGDKHG